MSNSYDPSKEQEEVFYDLSEEFNRDKNKDLYDIIEKAYKIVMDDTIVDINNIHGSDIIKMISITVTEGTINVYKKLKDLEKNISSSNNILDKIEYVKFIKAKLFSKIIDNVEIRDIYRNKLTDLVTRENNGLNIESRLALVNFQSEIIDLYNNNGEDAINVNYKTLKKEELPKEEEGEGKKGGGKRSRKSRKTKRARKSRRTRRRRRN